MYTTKPNKLVNKTNIAQNQCDILLFLASSNTNTVINKVNAKVNNIVNRFDVPKININADSSRIISKFITNVFKNFFQKLFNNYNLYNIIMVSYKKLYVKETGKNPRNSRGELTSNYKHWRREYKDEEKHSHMTGYLCPECEKHNLKIYNGMEVMCVDRTCRFSRLIADYMGMVEKHVGEYKDGVVDDL